MGVRRPTSNGVDTPNTPAILKPMKAHVSLMSMMMNVLLEG